MKYYIIKDSFLSENGEIYITYGIELREKKRVIKRISDISMSKRKIKNLCKLCNRLNLDEIHFADVAEDFILDA